MQIFFASLSILLALDFLLAGIMKFVRPPFMLAHWTEYRYPLSFMTVTGIMELACAIALITGIWFRSWSIAASLFAIVLMVGAVYTHLFRAGHPFSMTIHAWVLILLSVILLLGTLFFR